MVEHRSVVQPRARIAQDYAARRRDDRVLQTAPIGFDISVWEILCRCFAGRGSFCPNPARSIAARSSSH